MYVYLMMHFNRTVYISSDDMKRLNDELWKIWKEVLDTYM